MKFVKPMMFMALGAGVVVAYQKYSKPMMEKIEDATSEVIKKMDKKLDNMIN